MSIAMKIVRLADGSAMPGYDGKFVKEFDASHTYPHRPDLPDEPGQCWLVVTDNIREAKAYASIIEAREDWIQVDQRQPVRPDGQPNRPLTAFTVTFEQVPEGIHEVWRA